MRSAKKQCLETMLAKMKGTGGEKEGRKRFFKTKYMCAWFFFLTSFPPAAVHGFLISSETAERDELSLVPNPFTRASPVHPPMLWWSSMNSPYCCLMEMGTQTNEQPLPGSAPWVLINPDAETLMALIFQTKRRLRLRRFTALPQQERICFNQRHSPKAKRV